jgi:signal peptidase II
LLAVAILVILADQATKMLVDKSMVVGQSVSVVGDFFHLTFIRNPGGAFGTSLGGSWFYLVSSVVAILLICFYFNRLSTGHVWSRVALAMILGGALGNLADRLHRGAVTDFLDFGVGRLRWPVFNLADAAVTVGVALLFGAFLFKKAEDCGKDKENHRPSSD